MKMNKGLLPELKYKWHLIRIHYHQVLLEGCLDCQIKEKLKGKITYHKMKLENLSIPHYVNKVLPVKIK
ncbi:hypothetical protein [Rossellomorea aquimaris]|uniref:hypothetical protein n=1 Tax=Rossellomorea aquimaris TaxID=189382 RepID=UPI0007D0AFDC|nr:hypothetical protein [Rossellomorea aquimaris]